MKDDSFLVIFGVIFVLVSLLAIVLLSVVVVGAAEMSKHQEEQHNGGQSEETETEWDVLLAEFSKTALDAMDTTVDPCDDFYQYACGGWLAATVIPDAKASVTRSFTSISDKNVAAMNKVVQEEWPLVSTLYNNCMNVTLLNDLGAKPLIPMIKLINSTFSTENMGTTALKYNAIFKLIGEFHKRDFSGFFSFYPAQDFQNAQYIIGNLDQGGLGLANVNYYLQNDTRSEFIRTQYKLYITSLFALLHEDTEAHANGDEIARKVLEFETDLARISLSPTEQRNPHAVYHKIAYHELSTRTSPNFPWDVYFDALGVDNTTQPKPLDYLNLATPTFFANLFSVMERTDIQTLKHYLVFHLVAGSATLLSNKFVDARFNYLKQVYGLHSRRPRSEECVSTTQGHLGFMLGHFYVEKYFNQESKDAALELIHEIESSFEKYSLEKLTFMDATTKANAKSKLAHITNKIGYPDRWPLYEGFRLQHGNYYENIIQSTLVQSAKALQTLSKKVDPGEWGMYPQEVNAYYNPLKNEIVFPAGILQPPFFNATYLNAMNFGGIGMVIGHELTHGFDDEGSQFDATGNLTQWWTPETAEKFAEKIKCFANFYSEYSVKMSNGEILHLNGNLTLGENIADNGGLKHAYYAYKELGEKVSDEIVAKYYGEQFTSDKLFFVSFAQNWCTKATAEYNEQLIKSNPHAPARFRVLGPVSNSEEFASTFQCKKGTKMNPEKKCKLW